MATCCIKDCYSPSAAGDMCAKHYQRMKRTGSPLRVRRVWGATAEERFWPKVNKTETCWLWTGAQSSDGYGSFHLSHKGDQPRMVGAHRFAYELLVGPIPEGLVLDHIAALCPNRHCVKVIADNDGPAHLEPVTQPENIRRGVVVRSRKTHCRNGHPWVPETTYLNRRGFRVCVICRRINEARYRQKLRRLGR